MKSVSLKWGEEAYVIYFGWGGGAILLERILENTSHRYKGSP